MEKSKTYLKISLNNSKWKTVKDFTEEKDGILSDMDAYDFLIFDGGEGKKNIEKIYEKYDSQNKAKYESAVRVISTSSRDVVLQIQNKNVDLLTNMRDLPIIGSPEVFIPNSKCDIGLVEIRGLNQFLEQKNMVGFWSQKYKDIIIDEFYVRDENLSIEGAGSTVEIVNQNIKVWVWCRALNKILNLSPFINNLTTQKTDLGNFSIGLNPVDNPEEIFSAGDEDVLNYFSLLDNDKKVQIDFFHRNLQQNDVVFIRFERLKLEKKDSDTPFFKFEENSSNLPGQVWDMIGLIDSCSVSSNFNASDYSVSVSGRDMLKLLVEDGSYFMPLVYGMTAQEHPIVTIFEKDKFFKRFMDRQFGTDSFNFLIGGRRLDDSVGFVINQLSNLGVLGERGKDLFSSYKDRRVEIYKLAGQDSNELKKLTVDGVWQIIKVFVDEQLDKRRIVDESSVSEGSTILDQFMKICQDPFVEFYGDTYGDEFNFIVRQPPFNRDAILSWLGVSFVTKSSLPEKDGVYKNVQNSFNNPTVYIESKGQDCTINIDVKDLLSYNLQWDETYYSWYQIQPNQTYIGISQVVDASLIPIIYFPKITETFGNHRKIVVDNYLAPDLDSSNTSAIDTENYIEALLNDLKYLIDTNIYLPFTRKGTITLVKGDRRIKKGIFIRLVPTGEICYVDSVSQEVRFSSGEVNRSTTINVSRCMIEEYIKGASGYNHDGTVIQKGGKDVKFSYFDIVNTEIIVNNILSQLPPVNQSADSSVLTSIGHDLNSEYSVTIPRKTLAYKNNNPGNLRFVRQKRAIGKDAGNFCIFSTPEDGFKEEMRQIALYQSRGWTVSKMINTYAPKSDNNNTEEYIRRFCNTFKCSENEKLNNERFIGKTFEIAQKMIWEESNSTVARKETPIVKDPKNITNDLVSESTKIIVNSIPKPDTYKVPGLPKEENTSVINNTKSIAQNFGLDDDQFDFFQQRKQFNLFKK